MTEEAIKPTPFTPRELKIWNKDAVAAMGERVERDRTRKLARSIELRIESLRDQRAFKALGETGDKVTAARKWFDKYALSEASSIYFKFLGQIPALPPICRSEGIEMALNKLLGWCGLAHSELLGRDKVRTAVLSLPNALARKIGIYLLENHGKTEVQICNALQGDKDLGWLNHRTTRVRKTFNRFLVDLGFSSSMEGGYFPPPFMDLNNETEA